MGWSLAARLAACWRRTPRRVLLAHGAMAFASATFGGLNVIAKRALSDGSRSLNPYMFGLYRDVLACPLLLAWTTYKKGPSRFAALYNTPPDPGSSFLRADLS